VVLNRPLLEGAPLATVLAVKVEKGTRGPVVGAVWVS